MICYVIGKGSIGMRHASNISEIGIDLVHLSWREVEINSLRSKFIKINDKVCVVIATATNVRLPIIKLCAELDIPMYIEKPIGYIKKDLKEIFSISQELQQKSFVGLMMRYHPLIRYLTEQNLQNLYRFNIEIGHNVNEWRQGWKFSESYASNPNGGGVLLDLCHEIDLAYLLCDSLYVDKTLSFQHANFDMVDIASSILLSSKSGISCNISMDYLAPELIRRGTLVCVDKHLTYDLTSSTIIERSKQGLKENYFPVERNQMFIDAMKDFLNVVSGQSPVNPIAPRLDKVKDVCFHIADAWEKRQFIGKIEANLK
jgi:predicted dehydrogenase